MCQANRIFHDYSSVMACRQERLQCNPCIQSVDQGQISQWMNRNNFYKAVNKSVSLIAHLISKFQFNYWPLIHIWGCNWTYASTPLVLYVPMSNNSSCEMWFPKTLEMLVWVIRNFLPGFTILWSQSCRCLWHKDGVPKLSENARISSQKFYISASAIRAK